MESNTARKLTFEGTFNNIKNNLDISFANPTTMMTVSEKALIIIADWERKKLNATPEQKEIYNVEIRKLEALVQRMTDLILDCYEVEASAYIDSVGIKEQSKDVKDVLIEVAAAAEDKKDDAKIVSIFDGEEEVKTPKLSDLATACRQLIKKGKFDSAALLAGKYLTIGDYIPKKEKQKAKKWTEVEIHSWLKDLNVNLLEEKRKDKKDESANNNAAAKGLTTGEVENLRLLNLIITDSIAGHGDYESRRAVLKRYLNRGEDLKTEEEMLTAYASRKYDATHGSKLPEGELAALYVDLEKFEKIFFAHRGYTEESIKAWKEYINADYNREDPKHFEYLKAKDGVNLFPIKDKVTLPDEKIKPENKVDVSQVKTLLATIYKNGGEIADVKTHPEILDLIGKEIHINDKQPVLKFGADTTLLPWIETIFKEVSKQIGPLKKATDEEIAAKSAEVQQNSEVKAETNKVAKEKQKLIEQNSNVANLDDFILLIETAAKNNISVDDFLKENSSFVKNEKGGMKKLKTPVGSKGASSTVTLADDKDLKAWVSEVYKRFAKSDNDINKETTPSTEELVNSFGELIKKGKELLSNGTPVNEFMSWLLKNTLNRKLKEQKPGGEFKTTEAVQSFAKGTFKIDAKIEHKQAENVENKAGEPDNSTDEKYSAEDIAEIIANESKTANMTFMTLTRMMRDLYVSNGLRHEKEDREYSIKEILPIAELAIKDSNPEMYAERQKRKDEAAKKEKGQGKLALEEDAKPAETKNKIENSESPIFEKVDLKAQDADLYENTISKINTMDGLFNMATEYHEAGKNNEGLSLCLERMPLIEESKNWTPEQITNWYETNILKKTPIQNAEVVNEEYSEVEVPDSPEYKNLMDAKNPKFFKRAIGEIIRKHNDSKETRDRIITAIKYGEGSHTRQVSKMPVGEMHKQITNIKEKVEANANKGPNKEE